MTEMGFLPVAPCCAGIRCTVENHTAKFIASHAKNEKKNQLCVAYYLLLVFIIIIIIIIITYLFTRITIVLNSIFLLIIIH